MEQGRKHDSPAGDRPPDGVDAAAADMAARVAVSSWTFNNTEEIS